MHYPLNTNLDKQYKSSTAAILLIWLIFTSTAPFEFYSVIPFHPYKYLTFYLLGFIFVHFIGRNINAKIDVIAIIIIIQIFYTIFAVPQHLFFLDTFDIDDAEIYINLLIQLLVILILYFYVNTFVGMKILAESFIRVMVFIQILGIIIFIGGILGLVEPISTYTAPGARALNNYLLAFSPPEAVVYFGGGSLIRVAGFFDEPGANAYYIIFAIVINRLYGFSKKAEITLIAGGVTTLSLAFFITITIYKLGEILLNKKYLKLFVSITLLMAVIVSISNLKDQVGFASSLYELTVYRIQTEEIGDDKLVAGDNRSINLSASIDAFIKAPFFGHGKNAHSNPKNEFVGKLCCNPMHPFATEGIIGVFIYFQIIIIWTFIILIKSNSIGLVNLIWVMVMLTLAQRPGFQHGAFGYFIFIFLFFSTKWRFDNHQYIESKNVWNDDDRLLKAKV